jgi:hypothetical protein
MVLGSCARAASVARSRLVRCSSSVVEHPLGKGEVESSILSCSTIKIKDLAENLKVLYRAKGRCRGASDSCVLMMFYVWIWSGWGLRGCGKSADFWQSSIDSAKELI